MWGVRACANKTDNVIILKIFNLESKENKPCKLSHHLSTNQEEDYHPHPLPVKEKHNKEHGQAQFHRSSDFLKNASSGFFFYTFLVLKKIKCINN